MARSYYSCGECVTMGNTTNELSIAIGVKEHLRRKMVAYISHGQDTPCMCSEIVKMAWLRGHTHTCTSDESGTGRIIKLKLQEKIVEAAVMQI